MNEEDDYAGIYLGANFIPSMQIMCRESRLFLPSFQPGARGERENELYAGVVKKFTSKHIANYEISDISDHEVGHHHYCCSVRVFKTRSVCRPLQKKKYLCFSPFLSSRRKRDNGVFAIRGLPSRTRPGPNHAQTRWFKFNWDCFPTSVCRIFSRGNKHCQMM